MKHRAAKPKSCLGLRILMSTSIQLLFDGALPALLTISTAARVVVGSLGISVE